MQTNNILTASWLDILFDNRNKAYGAYELRNSYSKRVVKALLITTVIVTLVLTGILMKGRKGNNAQIISCSFGDSMVITTIEEKKVEPLPELQREQEPEPESKPVKTEQFTSQINIVPEEDFDEPTPGIDDLANAKPDVFTGDGEDFTGQVVKAGTPGNGRGIVEAKPQPDPDEIQLIVQVPSKFIGDWSKFLHRNLRGDVPVENGAAPGRYTVIIQFVVDTYGNVSDIKPLTSIGFGMEEEAIRVIKKATKWEPAFQNGYVVKAYHKQPITFLVQE